MLQAVFYSAGYAGNRFSVIISPVHPLHRLRCRPNAIHRERFIPHDAISVDLMIIRAMFSSAGKERYKILFSKKKPKDMREFTLFLRSAGIADSDF